MNPAEIRELSPDELWAKLAELREELFNLKLQHATGQLENPMRIGLVKKDVARVLTLIREQELAEAG